MSIEIITRKLSTALNAHPGAVLMGDMRKQMASDLLKSLTYVIEKKADHPRPYFILVATHIDPVRKGVIKERLILLDEMPKKRYLGTILVRVDNRHADAEIVWNLPLDIPAPGFIAAERANHPAREGVTSIMESAQGIGLVNRRAN